MRRVKRVRFEVAKTLQSLRYNGEWDWYYQMNANNTRDIKLYSDASRPPDIKDGFVLPAPRLDDVAYWIEDAFNIAIDVSPIVLDGGIAGYQGSTFPPCEAEIVGESRNEVLEKVIDQALKTIKESHK